jgi:hypothetical protein
MVHASTGAVALYVILKRQTVGTLGAFSERLQSQRRTLTRALTDPRIFSGIGNAYSNEILQPRVCLRCN